MKSTSVKFSQELDEQLPPLEELRNFTSGQIWRYIEASLVYRLDGCRDNLEDSGTTHEEDLLNKGRAEELRFLLNFPQFLIDNYEGLIEEVEQYKEKKKGDKNE